MKPGTMAILAKTTVPLIITGSSVLPKGFTGRDPGDVDLLFKNGVDLQQFITDIAQSSNMLVQFDGYEDSLVKLDLDNGEKIDCMVDSMHRTFPDLQGGGLIGVDYEFNIAVAKLRILFDRKDSQPDRTFSKHFEDIKRMLGV